MKIVSVAGAFIVAFLSESFAADMPQSAPPPVYAVPAAPPRFDWTAFYVGINGGYGWAGLASGVVGGGTIGFNYEFANSIVVGIEGDADYSSIKYTTSVGVPGASATASATINPLATARVRAGYAFDNWLPYGTVGFATARIVFDESECVTILTTTCTSNSNSKFYSGLSYGAGLEYAFTRYLSVRAEYLYSTVSGTTTLGGSGFSISLPASYTVETVRVGLVWLLH